jgi:Tol biopolymer transport system component
VVIELATGAETLLVAGISSVGWPLWTLDGGAVVFTSVRGSSSVVMSVPLANGAATDRPKVEWRAGRSEIRLMGFGADGSLFAMERPGPRTAYVAPIDLSRSFAGPPQLVDPADAENTIGADWSPDGSRVAYLRGLLGHPGGPPGTLVIRTAGGGVVTEIPLPGWMPESATQVRWSPDGRRLAVAYGGATPRAMAIDVVDLDTRRGQPVVSGEPFAYPRWEPSGEWLYYQQDAAIVRHHLSSGTRFQAYAAEGLGIQRNGGFDVSREDGALAILVTRPKMPGCMIRVVEPAGSTVDRHTFVEHCRAIAWSRDGNSFLVSTMSYAALPSLWSLHRHSGAPIRLPIEADVFHDLSLSPSGDRLLFSAGNPQFKMLMITGLQR